MLGKLLIVDITVWNFWGNK